MSQSLIFSITKYHQWLVIKSLLHFNFVRKCAKKITGIFGDFFQRALEITGISGDFFQSARKKISETPIIFISWYHLFHNKNDCFRDCPNDITMFAHDNHFKRMLINVRSRKNKSRVHLMNHLCESIMSFHLFQPKMKALVGLQMKTYTECIICNGKKIFLGKGFMFVFDESSVHVI